MNENAKEVDREEKRITLERISKYYFFRFLFLCLDYHAQSPPIRIATQCCTLKPTKTALYLLSINRFVWNSIVSQNRKYYHEKEKNQHFVSSWQYIVAIDSKERKMVCLLSAAHSFRSVFELSIVRHVHGK